MIDITKQYKTRDGRGVRILCVDGPHEQYSVIGLIGASLSTTMWSLGGEHILNPALDLIEVKPKIVVERWVNIYQLGHDAAVQIFHNESYALTEKYSGHEKLLARAVPFRWEGPG